MNSKIESYIGFAVRKGSAVFGVDNIVVYRKKMYLILATKSLSENSVSRLKKCAIEKNIFFETIEDYESLSKKNCKALAICDKSLADAIRENLK